MTKQREGGALQGFNKYSETDESSSESEPEQPAYDETDASTHSFVSNGERVWRAPDGIFSKRRQSAPSMRRIENTPLSPRNHAPLSLETDRDCAIRNSGGADSNASRRSSGGPDIPRLNFIGMSTSEEKHAGRAQGKDRCLRCLHSCDCLCWLPHPSL